jgi:hypothetical protein
VAVGFAAWYGYAPALLPAAVRAPLRTASAAVGTRLALTVVGAAAGVLGLLYAWVTRGDTPPTRTAPPDEEGERDAAVAGRELSARHERTVAAGGPDAPDDAPAWRRLRAVVVAAHRDGAGGETAEAYVDRGAWTADRYAAAFLSTTAEVDYPWYHRLYAWLYPERAHERRVERALRAVERACADGLSGYDAPDASGPRAGWLGRLRRLRRRLGESS